LAVLRAEPLVVVFRGHRSRLFRLRLRSVHRLRLLFGGLLFGSFRCGLFRHLRLFGGLRLFLGGRVSRIVSLVNVACVIASVVPVGQSDGDWRVGARAEQLVHRNQVVLVTVMGCFQGPSGCLG
jgi:hypothetical protein